MDISQTTCTIGAPCWEVLITCCSARWVPQKKIQQKWLGWRKPEMSEVAEMLWLNNNYTLCTFVKLFLGVPSKCESAIKHMFPIICRYTKWLVTLTMTLTLVDVFCHVLVFFLGKNLKMSTSACLRWSWSVLQKFIPKWVGEPDYYEWMNPVVFSNWSKATFSHNSTIGWILSWGTGNRSKREKQLRNDPALDKHLIPALGSQ